jgi:hypothetical protein
MHERPLSAVPHPVWWLLIVSICLQLIWQSAQPRPVARAEALVFPPHTSAFKMLSLGEPITLAQFMTLYIQAFDNQPGISIPFKDLDYDRVEAWLSSILALDPVGQYPLLMASHLYAQVPDESKQRKMLDFIYRQFLRDPNLRWPWLAHAAIIAKHRLNDLPLALEYAEAISRHSTASGVPHWATQMRIFILEDMGEIESAKVLLGGLLVSGVVTDSHEIHFLTERLQRLEAAEKSSKSSKK